MQDSIYRYGKVSKCFHWLMAILIAWQLLKIGDRINEGDHWIGQVLVSWHISIGTLLLGLIVLRLLWALSQRQQRPRHNPATVKLVTIGHGLLYACMLLMPITGVMVMVGGGYGLTAFGVEILAKDEGVGWAASVGRLHSPLAWAFTVLLIGHIGMAFIHHFIKGDDTLKRMM